MIIIITIVYQETIRKKRVNYEDTSENAFFHFANDVDQIFRACFVETFDYYSRINCIMASLFFQILLYNYVLCIHLLYWQSDDKARCEV